MGFRPARHNSAASHDIPCHGVRNRTNCLRRITQGVNYTVRCPETRDLCSPNSKVGQPRRCSEPSQAICNDSTWSARWCSTVSPRIDKRYREEGMTSVCHAAGSVVEEREVVLSHGDYGILRKHARIGHGKNALEEAVLLITEAFSCH